MISSGLILRLNSLIWVLAGKLSEDDMKALILDLEDIVETLKDD